MSTPRWVVVFPGTGGFFWAFSASSFKAKHGNRWKDYLFSEEQARTRMSWFVRYSAKTRDRRSSVKVVKPQVVKDWYRDWSRGLT